MPKARRVTCWAQGPQPCSTEGARVGDRVTDRYMDTQSNHYAPCLKKNCAKLFLSELCQISTNCENFWHKDGKEDKLM